MSLRPLHVDMLSILDAMEAYGDAPHSYLDLDTGEVVPWIDPAISGIDPEFDPDEDNVVAVPRRDARASLQVMQRFADGLDEADLKERLRTALAARGAFGRFRAELSRYPDLRARCEVDNRADLLARALDWLRSLGIEPGYELPDLPVAAVPTRRQPEQARISVFDLLLLGAPEGRTELLDGRVDRVYVAENGDAARRVFVDLARELTGIEGIGWRRRLVEGRDDYQCGRCHLSVEDAVVHLEVDVPWAVWSAFCR